MSYVEPLLAQLTQVGWDEETTYKERPTNLNKYFRLHSPPTIPWPSREIEVVHAPGHGRGPAYVHDQQRWNCEGTLPLEVISGEFIGALFGTCDTTGTGPDYTHTYNLSSIMPKSFGLQFAFLKTANNVIQEFLGCRANKGVFKSAEDNERLLLDIDYFAAKPQDGGASEETVTEHSDPPFTFKQGVFSSTALYTGAKARIHSFELPININAKPNYAGGSEYYPYDILPGKADFGELKLGIGLEDDAEWDEIIGTPGTVYDWEYLLTRGTNDTIKFSGNAKMKGAPPTVDEHDIRADLTLVPYTCTCVIVNTTETPWAFEAA